MAKETYDVGYKKPPTKTRFQKGKSGNPKGRPKGSRNQPGFFPANSAGPIWFQRQIVEAGYAHINVIKDGQTVSMTKIEAMLAQLYNKAMNGELAAAKLLLQNTQKSLIDLDKASDQIHKVTLQLRASERRKIFSPPPKPGTHGELLYHVHEIFSARFAKREIYGEELVPKSTPAEPDTEYDWPKFNETMRNQYLRLGDKESSFDLQKIPAILYGPDHPI